MANNYAIIQNQIVVNVAVSEPQYAKEQGWVELTENAGIGWKYMDGQFLPPAPFNYSEENKTTATSLLQQTDWTATVDISNPEYSNPYLTNQDAFLVYRSQVRQIAINPPTTPAVFPTKPEPQWNQS